MSMPSRRFLAWGAAVSAAAGLAVPLRAADDKVTYQDHILPLFRNSCLNCHNAIHGSNAPGSRGKFFTR